MYIFEATSAVLVAGRLCLFLRSVTCSDLHIRSSSPEGGGKDASERGDMVKSHFENL